MAHPDHSSHHHTHEHAHDHVHAHEHAHAEAGPSLMQRSAFARVAGALLILVPLWFAVFVVVSR